ncbi:UNVERIFIED_CONTAM: hypothetical protein NY100_06455 [Prevotella sp. 15_C9]
MTQIKRNKIQLYKIRSFGDKFTDTFDFLKENARLWLKGCLYLLLPISLVQAFSMNFLTSVYTAAVSRVGDVGDALLIKLSLSYFSYILFFIIGGLLLSAFMYAMMRHYHENENGLRGVTLKILKPKIMKALKRTFLMGLVLSLTCLLVYGLLILLASIMNDVGMLLLIALFFLLTAFLVVPLMLAVPIYVFEEERSVFGAIQQSFHLALRHFWGILGFLIVLNLLVSVVQGCFSLPWYIMFLLKVFFTIDADVSLIWSSPLYSFGQYLFGVVQVFGTYLSMSLSIVGLGLQYGSLAEEVDDFSVDEDIDNFAETPKEDKAIDDFENLV